MFRFTLRTLLIAAALGPLWLAGLWFGSGDITSFLISLAMLALVFAGLMGLSLWKPRRL